MGVQLRPQVPSSEEFPTSAHQDPSPNRAPQSCPPNYPLLSLDPQPPPSPPQPPANPCPSSRREPRPAVGGRQQSVCRPRGDAGARPVGLGVRRHVGPGGFPRGVQAAQLRLGDSGRARLALRPWPRTHPPGPGELFRGRDLPVGLPGLARRRVLWPQGGRWSGVLRSARGGWGSEPRGSPQPIGKVWVQGRDGPC